MDESGCISKWKFKPKTNLVNNNKNNKKIMCQISKVNAFKNVLKFTKDRRMLNNNKIKCGAGEKENNFT